MALFFSVSTRYLEHPGTFRTEMLVSSWAEHLRQLARMTKAETELVERVWAMHAGDEGGCASLPSGQAAIDSAWLLSVPKTI